MSLKNQEVIKKSNYQNAILQRITNDNLAKMILVEQEASKKRSIGKSNFSWGSMPDNNIRAYDLMDSVAENKFKQQLLDQNTKECASEVSNTDHTHVEQKDIAEPDIRFNKTNVTLLRSIQRLRLQSQIRALLQQVNHTKLGMLKLTTMQYSLLPSIMLSMKSMPKSDIYKTLQKVSALKVSGNKPQTELETLILAYINCEGKSSLKRREQLLVIQDLAKINLSSDQMASLSFYATTELKAQKNLYRASSAKNESYAINNAISILAPSVEKFYNGISINNSNIKPVEAETFVAKSEKTTAGYARSEPFAIQAVRVAA